MAAPACRPMTSFAPSASAVPSPTRSTRESPSSCTFMRAGRDGTEDDAYDIEVVDEAVVNAVAHRDYSVSGSKIRLFLFADRLELYSPGKLPNGITIEQMPYRTFTRNQLLVSFLSKMRSKRTGRVFLESRGEGVRKILEGGGGALGAATGVRAVRERVAVDGVGEGEREPGEQEVAQRGLAKLDGASPPGRDRPLGEGEGRLPRRGHQLQQAGNRVSDSDLHGADGHCVDGSVPRGLSSSRKRSPGTWLKETIPT